MKRARRERALGRLYSALDSADYDERELAMFQLALLLRRAKGTLPAGDWTDQDLDNLPRDLLRIRLSPTDQAGAVARLAQVLARRPDSRASALWAMGEASATVGLPAALAALQAHGDQLSDEAAFQLCRALQRWLAPDGSEKRHAGDAHDDCDYVTWLKRWSRSTDRRLVASANAVMRALRQ
ncbi:MAG: hypothetical protein OXI34_13105 [Chloroflexota bacterium]|nr:hypothetical protein [Chloroflexota bacterium]MDE2948294.1 hypothetical protein [Chloroflexota bacterium]